MKVTIIIYVPVNGGGEGRKKRSIQHNNYTVLLIPWSVIARRQTVLYVTSDILFSLVY